MSYEKIRNIHMVFPLLRYWVFIRRPNLHTDYMKETLLTKLQREARETIKLNRKCGCKDGNTLVCDTCSSNQAVALFLVANTLKEAAGEVQDKLKMLPWWIERAEDLVEDIETLAEWETAEENNRGDLLGMHSVARSLVKGLQALKDAQKVLLGEDNDGVC